MIDMNQFLWLGVGAFVSLLNHGRWMIPLAPWLALAALLHFAHVEGPVAGFLWIWFALSIAYGVSNRGVMPLPGAAYVAMFVAIGLLSALPFFVDRLLVAREPGFFSTLVFPMAWVAIEFGGSRVNPYGTWGCLAYTQSGNLPLIQLVSVTGISGVAFLIAWTAAVTNWASDHRFEWATIGPGILTYATAAGATALGGGARLLRTRQNDRTVRVAGIGWPEEILARRDVIRLYTPPTLSETEQAGLRQRFKLLQEKFLHDTTREARAGAKIVVWPEASALALVEDEPAYLDRSQQAAREAGIYLLMAMGIIHTGQPQSMENKAVLIGPSGEVCWS